MDKLSKDELTLLAFELDLPDLLRFCSSSKRINDKIYKQNAIWINKLKKDYQINYYKKRFDGPKDLYKNIYKLLMLKINRGFDEFISYYPPILTDLINTIDLKKTFIIDSIDAVKRGRKKNDVEIEISCIWSRYAVGEFDWGNVDQFDVDKLFNEFNNPNYLLSIKREWSAKIIHELERNQYWDSNTGKIVNLQNRPDRPTNEFWLPSIKVVGTEEDILKYFLKLNVNEDIIRRHIAGKLP